MSSPNKLTLNTNPLQYKRARSKGVNKISKISKVSKIKKIATNDKNTENMGYSPFKMKGASLYRSPAKDTGAEYNKKAKAESPSGRGLSESTIKAHDEGHATKWKPGTHEDKTATKKSPMKDSKSDYDSSGQWKTLEERESNAKHNKAHQGGLSEDHKSSKKKKDK